MPRVSKHTPSAEELKREGMKEFVAVLQANTMLSDSAKDVIRIVMEEFDILK